MQTVIQVQHYMLCGFNIGVHGVAPAEEHEKNCVECQKILKELLPSRASEHTWEDSPEYHDEHDEADDSWMDYL